MNFRVLAVGHRVKQTKHVFAGLVVKSVDQHRLRRGHQAPNSNLGIIYDDVAIILDSKFGTDLQRNLRWDSMP